MNQSQESQYTLLSGVLALALRIHSLTPNQIAEKLYPRPTSATDENAGSRVWLEENIAGLIGPSPHPDDRVISVHELLAFDRLFSLPRGFCLVVAALEDAIVSSTSDEPFISRVQPLSPPTELGACFMVLVPKSDGTGTVFVDGRLPSAAGSFPPDDGGPNSAC